MEIQNSFVEMGETVEKENLIIVERETKTKEPAARDSFNLIVFVSSSMANVLNFSTKALLFDFQLTQLTSINHSATLSLSTHVAPFTVKIKNA